MYYLQICQVEELVMFEKVNSTSQRGDVHLGEVSGNHTQSSLEKLKPKPVSIPAHLADNARQTMAGVVFTAKNCQEVAQQGHMHMGQSHNMSSMPTHSHTGAEMSAHVMAPTAAIGAALAGIGAPISVFNAYKLGQNWHQMSHMEKTGETMKLTGTVALAGVGGLIIGGIAKGSAMALMPVVAAAGPAGLGAIAAGNVVVGAWNIGKITHLGIKKRRIASTQAKMVESHTTTKTGQILFDRAKSKLTSEMKSRMAMVGILAVTTVGLGLGAAVIAGALATPVGWVAAGLVLAGLGIAGGITLGRYIYRKVKARKQIKDADTQKKEEFIAESVNQDVSKDELEALRCIQQELYMAAKVNSEKPLKKRFFEAVGVHKNEQKSIIKEKLKERRNWFSKNLKSFKPKSAADASQIHKPEERAEVIHMVLEINNDLLNATANFLIIKEQ